MSWFEVGLDGLGIAALATAWFVLAEHDQRLDRLEGRVTWLEASLAGYE